MPLIPNPPFPSWADPNQANSQDPLYQTLLRKAVGVFGLNDPTAAVMGAAAPGGAEGTGGLLDYLSRIKAGKVAPLGASQELINLLTKFAPSGTPGGSAAGTSIGGSVPQPTTTRQIFGNMLSRNPDLTGAFQAPEKADLARPPGMRGQLQREAAVRGAFQPTMEESLNKDMASGAFERPSVTDPSMLRDVMPQPAQGMTAKLHYDTTNGRSGASMKQGLLRLAKAGLTVDDIKAMRDMGLDAATAKYKLPRNTLLPIINRESYPWIQ